MTENIIKEDKKDIITLNLPKKPEYVSVVRLTASAIASRIGFNIEEIDDIKVAIAEACTYVLKIGTSRESENFDIEFIIQQDNLSITVKDAREEKEESSYKSFSLEENNEVTLGVFIIESLMDEVELSEDNGLYELRMIKRIGVGD